MSKDSRMMDGTKIPFHMDRVSKWIDNGERIMPIHIDMGITKKCNARCVYCYGINQRLTGEMIDPEVLERTMKEAGAMGIRSIGFVGDGEPTLNPGVYKSLIAGAERGIDMAISTNGVLLDNDKKRLDVVANCTWMRFNLSAANAESYKRIHNIDFWPTVRQNIREVANLKRVLRAKCDVGLQAVFVPGLMNKDVVELAKFAVEAGVDYLVVKQCSLPDGNRAVGEIEFDVNDYDKPEVVDALKEAEAQSTDATKIIVKWGLISQKGTRPYSGCLGIPFLPQISGNGDVYPCGQMFGNKEQYLKYRMGNLHETSLSEILYSDRYWAIVEEMKSKFDVHKDCFGACRQDRVNEWLYNYASKDDWTKRQLCDLSCAIKDSVKGVNFI